MQSFKSENVYNFRTTVFNETDNLCVRIWHMGRGKKEKLKKTSKRNQTPRTLLISLLIAQNKTSFR
ncbi:hypothetical protein PGB90_006657 [Kerria lacca]